MKVKFNLAAAAVTAAVVASCTVTPDVNVDKVELGPVDLQVCFVIGADGTARQVGCDQICHPDAGTDAITE